MELSKRKPDVKVGAEKNEGYNLKRVDLLSKKPAPSGKATHFTYKDTQ